MNSNIQFATLLRFRGYYHYRLVFVSIRIARISCWSTWSGTNMVYNVTNALLFTYSNHQISCFKSM